MQWITNISRSAKDFILEIFAVDINSKLLECKVLKRWNSPTPCVSLINMQIRVRTCHNHSILPLFTHLWSVKYSAKPQTVLYWFLWKTMTYCIYTSHFPFGPKGSMKTSTDNNIEYDEERKWRGNENGSQARCTPRQTQVLLIMACVEGEAATDAARTFM